MATKRKVASGEELFRTQLDKARALLLSRGAVTTTQLGPLARRESVAQALVEEGYERTPKGLRRPLGTQLEELLRDGAYLPSSELRRRLKGVTKVEGEALIREAQKKGLATLVLRGKQLTIVPAGEDVLDRSALREFAAELKRLQAWVQKAEKDKGGPTLLRSDTAEALRELQSLVQPKPKLRSQLERASPAPTKASELGQAVRGAILALRDEESLLAAVPRVSERLETIAPPDRIVEELLAGHARGELELRPEGGIGRLSAKDAARCPIGAGNLPLSFVRLREVKQ